MGIAGRKFGYRGKIKRCSFVISNTEGTYDRRPRTWKFSMASEVFNSLSVEINISQFTAEVRDNFGIGEECHVLKPWNIVK
jgi:hypothetical protein